MVDQKVGCRSSPFQRLLQPSSAPWRWPPCRAALALGHALPGQRGSEGGGWGPKAWPVWTSSWQLWWAPELTLEALSQAYSSALPAPSRPFIRGWSPVNFSHPRLPLRISFLSASLWLPCGSAPWPAFDTNRLKLLSIWSLFKDISLWTCTRVSLAKISEIRSIEYNLHTIKSLLQKCTVRWLLTTVYCHIVTITINTWAFPSPTSSLMPLCSQSSIPLPTHH